MERKPRQIVGPELVEEFLAAAEKHRPGMENWARKRASQRNSAEDLYAEGIASAFSRLDTYSPDRGPMEAFLLTWYRGGIMNFIRDHGSLFTGTRLLNEQERSEAWAPWSLDIPTVFSDPESGTLADTLPGSSGQDESWISEDWVAWALSQLPDDQEYVLRRRVFSPDEPSQKTIGEELGRNQMYASRLEKRAIENLRKVLQGD